MPRQRLAFVVCAALALPGLVGCGDEGGDYPALLPTGQVLAEPVLSPDYDPATSAAGAQQVTGDLIARANALRARAAALRAAAVIEAAARARMQAAVNRHR